MLLLCSGREREREREREMSQVGSSVHAACQSCRNAGAASQQLGNARVVHSQSFVPAAPSCTHLL
jgi:hypothetical protein